MARKTGLSKDDVVDAAEAIADEQGLDTLTLQAVAARLGVRPPTVCYHVTDLPGLRRLLALRAAGALGRAFDRALRGRSGTDALRAAARAQRAFAKRHPGLYAATTPAPRPGEDDVLYEALAVPVRAVAQALSAQAIEGDEAIHVIRTLRAYVHGWVLLERDRGFGMPVGVDASFERGLDLLLHGLP